MLKSSARHYGTIRTVLEADFRFHGSSRDTSGGETFQEMKSQQGGEQDRGKLEKLAQQQHPEEARLFVCDLPSIFGHLSFPILLIRQPSQGI